jgi:CheY-like chemotaxis protein
MDSVGKILLADDDEIFLQATAHQLERAGFTCTLCRGGGQVLSALRAGHYDLLISDINMPGNANLELVRQLQEISPSMPVILVTGYPTLDTAVVSVNLTVSAYLLKPVNYEDLVRLIGEILPRSRMAYSLSESRKHLDDWKGELDQMIAALDKAPGREYPLLVDAFINLAIKNITSSLRDIQSVTAAASTGQPLQQVCSDFNCPQNLRLNAALRETIKVLQETKNSFKSTELAGLRKKLETLIN